MKERLEQSFYIRYTDDIVVLGNDPDALCRVLLAAQTWLQEERCLRVHPRKISLRKLRQGVDFLGYVTLPYHCVLRTRTKQRMFRRLTIRNVESYLGLLRHCDGRAVRQQLLWNACELRTRRR